MVRLRVANGCEDERRPLGKVSPGLEDYGRRGSGRLLFERFARMGDAQAIIPQTIRYLLLGTGG